MGFAAGNWLTGFVLVSVAIVVAVLVWLRRRNVKITQLMASQRAREPLPDDEFIRRGDFSPEESAYAIGIRNVLGDLMQVPRTSIYPKDTLGYVEMFFYDGMDLVEFAMALEDELALEIPDMVAAGLCPLKHYDKLTIRDIAGTLNRNRERLTPRKRRAAAK